MSKRRGKAVYELGVKSRFSAAHSLRDYAGKCASLHGHNWEVEVFVRGERLDRAGMVVDFGDLKQRVRAALSRFDHCDLRQLDEFRNENPTSENLARAVYMALKKEMPRGRFRLSRVVVRETPDSSAAYSEGE